MRGRKALLAVLVVTAMSAGPAPAAVATPAVAVEAAPLATTSLHYANNIGYSAAPRDVGFNLWDLGPWPGDVNALPAGHQALLWVGGDNSQCGSEYTDAQFNALVDSLAGNPKVFGWYLWDEPDFVACPTLLALISKRANYIRTRTGGVQKSFVASGGGDGEAAPAALAPARSGVDLIGLDPYPCRIGETCEYGLINQAVQQTLANGIPLAAIVPTYQAFGQTCSSIPTGNRKWRLPTATEMDQIFARWDSLVPSPVFDVAYSWGVQPEWSCPALSGSTTLRSRFAQRFAS
ncbi:hypothetical protein GCM10022225_15370 [Plantactinospora mayteni]|uniref:Uncharacterized protein n=1 Tax=Plantactinospora mayteni TaxID=566021 RepID=A0ABQ4EFW2_9ACTN|nr:hypothetical protein [Plantactinospora mayteni]GIG93611.1 hypothetical protein Pma05_01840 [Plantactinospora mayteni]